MNAKKITVSILLILFVLFGTISSFVYNKSDSVDIICYDGSYAEEYAEKHNLDYQIISDSDAYLGILNLENFEYNNDGTIVAYKGESEEIAIPTDIEGTKIVKVAEKAFEDAKNLKSVYLPKTITTFDVKSLENAIVYMYEDTDLYKTLSKNEELTFEIKTIADSYFVDFYTADIPFSYNISDNTVDINRYHAYNKVVLIPESIDGKSVTAISFDAIEEGVETIVIPESVKSINGKMHNNRYDLTFLIGMLIALLAMVVAVVFVLTLKADTKEKVFLTIPQFRTAYIATILALILVGIYLFVEAVPHWVVFIGVAVVYSFAIISVIKTKVAASIVEDIDEKINVKTAFIKELAVATEQLVNTAKTTELKVIAKKIFEAVRYSDPMSNAALVEVEEKIQNTLTVFENAINSENYELASSVADELMDLVNIRNKQCKLLK